MSPKNNLFSFEKAKEQMSGLIKAYKPSRSIKRIEIKIRPVDMIWWLSLQRDEVKIYGANQSDTMSIAGIGQAVCVTGQRSGFFKKVFKQLRSFLSPQYPYLQWYGGFCFDERHPDADWKEFGAYRFVLPRFELAAQGGKMIFCCNLVGHENIADILKQLNKIVIPSVSSGGEELMLRSARQLRKSPIKGNPFLAADRVAIRQEEHLNIKAEPGPDDPHVQRTDDPDQKLWQKDVDAILADRSVEKVVLARKTSLYFKQAPDPWPMLRQLKAVTPNSYHFAFQFKKSVFLGASPERLYRRWARFIESEALAGTMPKRTSPQQLRNSPKNKYEHALVVDAIDASFKGFCKSFSRPKRPGILTLANGHHLITKFQGQLKDGVNDEDILQFLHPTPALGGSPKKQAMAMIRELEGFSRGWYGAPIGYVGWDRAEFVVGIRSGLVNPERLSVFAGAGIVRGSKARAEWDEVENKISNFIKIIR